MGGGEATRGVGGVEVVCVLGSVEAGGVGMGLLEVAEFFASEADESWRGRFGRAGAAEGMPPPRMVGEAVLCLAYLGR